MIRPFILLIKVWQRFISPILPPACRFSPSCSHYAVSALERHGLMKGSFLAAWRIVRCGPWSRGGIDEVPQNFAPFRRHNSGTN